METVTRYAPLAGRILLAAIFVLSGIRKLGGFEDTVAYIAAKGLPLPQISAVLAIALELGAGLMLVAGWRTRAAAVTLLTFTGVATVVFHAFWSVPPEAVEVQRIMFLKNLAIMGGLLYVMAYGSGPLSADGGRG
jgi:putative oxidoreductase